MGRIKKISEELVYIQGLFHKVFLVVIVLVAGIMPANAQETLIENLSQEQIRLIGERIFENECASKDENLIAWNEGEDFLSLGIGHFIWHPENSKELFEGSFIKFLEWRENPALAG